MCVLPVGVEGEDWLLAVADRLAEYDDHRLLQAECLDDLLLIPAATCATTQARAGAIEIDILRHIAHIDIRHRVGIAGAMARARLVGVGDEEQVEVGVGRLATPRDGAMIRFRLQILIFERKFFTSTKDCFICTFTEILFRRRLTAGFSQRPLTA